MIPDKMFFIEEPTLQLFMNQFDWKVVKPKLHNNLVIFKADFYNDGHVFAVDGKGKWAICRGHTIVEYKGETFHSVEKILERYGNDSINDFANWKFIEEKEWVVTKHNNRFLGSFSSLDTVRKSSKYR